MFVTGGIDGQGEQYKFNWRDEKHLDEIKSLQDWIMQQNMQQKTMPARNACLQRQK